MGYAQDRLARDALAGSECGGSFGEWQHGTHHRFEASLPYSRGEVGELGAIGFYKEEKCPPIARQGLRRLGDGDERSASPHQSRRAGQNVSADHIKHHIDFACVLELFGLQVEEGVDAELPRPVSVCGPARADDARTDLASELHRDRPNPTRGAVDQNRLSGGEAAVVEQACQAANPEIGSAAATV